MASRINSIGSDHTNHQESWDVSEPSDNQEISCSSEAITCSFNSIEPTHPLHSTPSWILNLAFANLIAGAPETFEEFKIGNERDPVTLSSILHLSQSRDTSNVESRRGLRNRPKVTAVTSYRNTSDKRVLSEKTSGEPSTSESENVPPTSGRINKRASVKKLKKGKGLKRQPEVNVEALYLQEGAHKKKPVFTSLETVHEDRDKTGLKRRRITVFDDPEESSNKKLKFRKGRANLLRKKGVNVPTGKMFSEQDILSALAHIDDEDIVDIHV